MISGPIYTWSPSCYAATLVSASQMLFGRRPGARKLVAMPRGKTTDTYGTLSKMVII